MSAMTRGRIGFGLGLAVVCLWLAGGLSAAAAPSAPRCQLDVCFEAATRLGSADVPLRGIGLLRVWGFKVYVAGFYAPGDAPKAGAADPGDGPKQLRIHYLRSIDRDDIVKAAEVHLAETPGVDVTALRSRLDRINASYQTVQAGDEYELRYEPEHGTTLLFNGRPVVTIPGSDFASAYFGLWVGVKPLNEALRASLLGQG